MKYLLSIKYLIVLFLTIVLGSCASKNEDNPTTSIITYTVDGTNVTSRASGVINLFVESNDSTVVDVFESNFGGLDAEVLLTVSSINNIVGTYPLASDRQLVLLDGNEQFNNYYLSSRCTSPSGQITITEHNSDERTISGTFEGQVCTSGGKSRTISGSFENVRYVIQVQIDSEG